MFSKIRWTILLKFCLILLLSWTNGVSTNSECLNCVGQTLTLSSGHAIPIVGLGTSKIGKTDEEVISAIKSAVNLGYRHIDTADFYLNEEAIGKALQALIKGNKTTRDQLFITTKVWSNYHTKEKALESVRNSLQKLKLDYLDLVLVHWPFSFSSNGAYFPKDTNGTLIGADPTKENFLLAYQGLEEAAKLNLTRSIGVSNFNISQLERLLKVAKIKPVVNQVESHPFLSQKSLLDYCISKDIKLEAYSPLRRGDSNLLENVQLKSIATAHNCTVAQVALRWQTQRNVIVIPRSSRPSRMAENKNIFGFTLTEQEMDKINGLNRDDRAILFEDGKHLPEYPF